MTDTTEMVTIKTTPQAALHMLELAQLHARELKNSHDRQRSMCGQADPVVGRYVVEIHTNNRLIADLMQAGVK